MKAAEAWTRKPFVGLAVAAVVGILAADAFPHPQLALWLIFPGALLAWFLRRSLAVYVLAALSFFCMHSWRQTESPGLRLARVLGKEKTALTVNGEVISDPQLSARGTSSFQLRLHWIEGDAVRRPSDAKILARWKGQVQFGDEVQLFGVIQPVDGPRNPGEFEMRAYLARHDIRHVLIARYPENGRVVRQGGGNPLIRAAKASRNWMQASLTRGLEDSPELHGLINGIVLGLRHETPDEVEEQFQQTGTIHLFAVSGLHVGIVAFLLWTLARACRLPRKWASALIIPALFFYAAVTGLNTSSVRAAIMAAFFLGGYFFDRKSTAGNSIAAAAVFILGFDSNQLFGTGFELSFAVVATIILFADPLYRSMRGWFAPDAFLPRALISYPQRAGLKGWQTIARGASVSLAAWIGSLPLILPYFSLITPVSLFANLIVVPIAFFVLALGMMSLITMPIAPALAVIFNNANSTLAAALLAAVDLFTHAPAGHFYVELPHRPTGAQVEITALDLGAGAAVHVRADSRDWLIDCGSARDFRRVTRGYLRSRGINRLDGLVLTHGDAGHIGGAISILRAFHPRALIDTPAPDRSSAHQSLIAHLQAQGIARRVCAAPEELWLSKNVTARLLFPPVAFKAGNADDQAMVLQLDVARRWRVLLTTDSGEATERKLLAQTTALASDVLIKGQHHSGISGGAEFIDRVRPRLIVATSPTFPENERVKDDWVKMVTQQGARLMRHDETGAVTLRFFSDRWDAIPFLESQVYEFR